MPRKHGLEIRSKRRVHRRYYNEPEMVFQTFCRCGWKGPWRNTKTAASRQYKIHKRRPVLSKKSMTAATKDLLQTFITLYAIQAEPKVTEWRETLGTFAESLGGKNKPYTVTTSARGRGNLIWTLNVSYGKWNSGKLGDWQFGNWVRKNKSNEYMRSEFSFHGLNDPKQLNQATKFVLHLDKQAVQLKQDYAKWAEWAVEYREMQLTKARRTAKQAKKDAAHKTTWEYLKERFQTKEAVEKALAVKTYSKSYTALLHRLIRYWEKRE